MGVSGLVAAVNGTLYITGESQGLVTRMTFGDNPTTDTKAFSLHSGTGARTVAVFVADAEMQKSVVYGQ